MTENSHRGPVNGYDLDPIAEVYDCLETGSEDIALIRRLIDGRGALRVLEPFAGTGRILIPLAEDGHRVTGLEWAGAMVRRAAAKVERLPVKERARIELRQMNLLREPWPGGFDLVILAGNCLYELATPEEQSSVIDAASRAVRPGGYLYVDNDHMEGPLAAAWCEPGEKAAFPSGRCADGTVLEGTMETLWTDVPNRLARFRRRVRVTLPDGEVRRYEFVQQKHPVSAGEVAGWLGRSGLHVERRFGDHQGTAYTEDSPRAIFWIQRGEGAAGGR